jgi:hypothetical protein
MSQSPLNGILELYAQAVPKQFFEQLEKDLGLPSRQRIFSLPLVVWLMISQRLNAKATLSTAVQQVVHHHPQTLLSGHKRILAGTVSCHTGAYSDARQAMPVVVTEKVADRVLNHLLLETSREALPGWSRQVFILDGSTLEMPHTADLVAAYPPDPKSHWPVLTVLVAQELTTGLAQRPCWGPMYGKKSVSGQALTEQILDRFPDHSVLLGTSTSAYFPWLLPPHGEAMTCWCDCNPIGPPWWHSDTIFNQAWISSMLAAQHVRTQTPSRITP